ncbi:MAG: carbohydrate ABC transporter substrate-binding protein [Anaerolineaceae bacterium]|nr:MAG: carbohydrate ABC transporter substrate-binding protein [Anaerolineaceae bacterium]
MNNLSRRLTVMMVLLSLLIIPAVSAQDDVVTIRFWNADTSGATEAAIEAWNSDNPNIQVEFVPYSNDDSGHTQVDTALLAGQVDAMINFGIQRVDSRARAGLFADLSELLPDFDIVEEFGTESTTYGDAVYAIPAGASFFMTYINADAFAEAGIEVPENWTWEEFIAIAEELTTGSGPSTRYGAMLPTWPWMDEVAAYERGWDFNVNVDACTTNFDDPIWAEVATIRYELETVAGAALPYAEARAAQLVQQNQLYGESVAMIISGTWILRSTQNTVELPRDFVTTFAPVPSLTEDGFPYRSGKFDDFMAVAANSDHPEEAAQFLAWLATDGYLFYTEKGRFPAWQGFDAEVVAEVYFSGFEVPAEEILDIEAFIRVALDNTRPLAPQQELLGNAELQTIWREEAVRVFNGELTGEEASANMKERGDRALASLCD